MQKNTKKKIAPIIITLLTVLYIGCLIMFALGAAGVIGFLGGCDIALPFLLIYALAGLAVIVGIILALRQRLQEINGGEEDEAGKY